jgi:hypothetical protein
MNRSLSIAAVFALALVVRADGPGLSLRIRDEAAPAGSVVQIKLDVTEPKPISTGRGKIRIRSTRANTVAVLAEQISGLSFNHVVLMNAGQDTYGVATVEPDGLSFDVVSPSSAFGTPVDMPILGIAATIGSSESNGSSFVLAIDPTAAGFRDPSGAVYPNEIQDGVLTVSSGAISISDVKPGSALVPAGGVVRITGANFTPDTRLDFNEVAIAQQSFISSTRIDVVLAQAALMHGRRIRARNDGDNGEQKSETEYYAWQRTSAAGASNDAIFGRIVPLFAPATYTDATVTLPRRVSRRQRAVRPSRPGGTGSARSGFALQNLQAGNAVVSIELLDAAGHPYAVNTVSIGPDQYLVREVGEVFGIVAPPSALRIRSNQPLQILGLTIDSSGNAAALPPT